MPLQKSRIKHLINVGQIRITPYHEDFVTDNGYKLHVGGTIRLNKSYGDYNTTNDTTRSINNIEYIIPNGGFILQPTTIYELDLLESIVLKDYSGQIVPDTTMASYGVNITVSSNITNDLSGPLKITLTTVEPITIYRNQCIANLYLASTSDSIIPSGGIIMWSGYGEEGIPYGWVLCNGENGTPDLRDRFIVGAGNNYDIGNKGGSNKVSLNVSELPEHTHDAENLNIMESFPSSLTSMIYIDNVTGSTQTPVIESLGSGHTHRITGYTGGTGGGHGHENRPPYYALAFIMKL